MYSDLVVNSTDNQTEVVTAASRVVATRAVVDTVGEVVVTEVSRAVATRVVVAMEVEAVSHTGQAGEITLTLLLQTVDRVATVASREVDTVVSRAVSHAALDRGAFFSQILFFLSRFTSLVSTTISTS